MIAHVYFPVQMYEHYIKRSALNSGLALNCIRVIHCSNLEISFLVWLLAQTETTYFEFEYMPKLICF